MEKYSTRDTFPGKSESRPTKEISFVVSRDMKKRKLSVRSHDKNAAEGTENYENNDILVSTRPERI